jgi:small subunit ribosomal protein S9
MATAKEPIKKEGKLHVPTRAAHTAVHRTHAPAASAPVAHAAALRVRYTEAIGRRKTAIARVRIMAGSGKMTVNDKDVKSYFTLPRLVAVALAPLKELQLGDIDVTVHVGGGGINAQAEAVRHGLARAIILKTPEWKPRLRAMGYVTRDSRMVERKKYGLRKARRAPQWAKR